MLLCARLRDSTKTLKLFRAKNRKAYQPGCRGRREHDKREVLRFTDRLVSRNFAALVLPLQYRRCLAMQNLLLYGSIVRREFSKTIAGTRVRPKDPTMDGIHLPGRRSSTASCEKTSISGNSNKFLCLALPLK